MYMIKREQMDLRISLSKIRKNSPVLVQISSFVKIQTKI